MCPSLDAEQQEFRSLHQVWRQAAFPGKLDISPKVEGQEGVSPRVLRSEGPGPCVCVETYSLHEMAGKFKSRLSLASLKLRGLRAFTPALNDLDLTDVCQTERGGSYSES